MNVFIINLQESTERREHMLSQCKDINLTAEVFPAINGKNFTEEDVREKTRPLNEIATNGELGCALSHIGIYQKIIDDNIPCALILEDDVLLKKDLPSTLESIEKSIGENEIIILNQPIHYLSKVIREIPHHQVHPVAEANLTCSYVITQAAAAAMISFLSPVWLCADRWSLVREFNVARINCLIPPACKPSELSKTTTIPGRYDANDREDRAKEKWIQIKRTRPIHIKIRSFFFRIYSRHVYKLIKTNKS